MTGEHLVDIQAGGAGRLVYPPPAGRSATRGISRIARLRRVEAIRSF